LIAPERRTRGDLIAAAAIATAVAMVIAAFWWNSSMRATISRQAAEPAAAAVAPTGVPAALTQRWTATSARTLSPIVVSNTVVTGDERTVAGLDPQTGLQRWAYARDTDLCGVSYVYDLAVAVYPDSRGCGQVSGIKAGTGQRGPTRTSYADNQVVLTSDGSAVLSTGPTRLELWRSDLVRILSYGELDARVKPVHQAVGTGCTLMSAAGTDTAVSVLEACRDTKDLRLTLIKPAKEEDEPDTKRIALPGLAVDSDARVLAVSGTNTAVFLPTPRPTVVVYDETATKVSETPLRSGVTVGGAAPAVTRAGDFISWWTGSSVVVFDKKLDYRYTLDALDPLGPATMMAGKLLVPLADGLGVYDPANGTAERVISIAHPQGRGPVLPAVSGSMVIEQRGSAMAGFGPS
jgi:outer membrane protein assembly factor BamB